MRVQYVSTSGRGWLLWLAAMGCLLPPGCAKHNVPAQPELARQSLEAALSSWKADEQLAALSARTPSITMADFAWTGNRKLVDYRLIGDAKTDGVNLHYIVELVLADASGGKSSEQVTYIVGTSPSVTIFRE